MLLAILLILANASITLAVPFSETSPIALLANRVNTVRAEVLNLQVTDRQVGLNFFPCTNDAVCVGDRRCLTFIEDSTFQPCTVNCTCIPFDPRTTVCSSESDCDDGESCVTFRASPGTFCVSDEVIPFVSDDPPVTGAPTMSHGGDPDGTGDEEADTQSGLNFSPCTNDAICAGARRCLTITEDSDFQPCTKDCFCLPLSPMDLLCSSESDCDDGESCVSLRSAPELPTLCISDVIIPSVSDNPPVTGEPTTTTSNGSSAINAVPVPVDEDSDNGALVKASPEEDDFVGSPKEDDFEGSPEEDKPIQSGLTFDPCQRSDDCAASRICFPLSLGRGCSEGACRCFPVPPILCESDSSCNEDGEGCFPISEVLRVPFLADLLKSANICASRAAITKDPRGTKPPATTITPEPPMTEATTTTTPEPPVSEDPNTTTTDSSSPLPEVMTTTTPEPPLGDDPTTTTPGSSSPLPEVTGQDEDNNDNDSGDQSTDICIGVDSLSHLSREQLVFETDAVARVLCDCNESCATPGHMVQYKGKGMMMKSYCELVGCVRKIMRVNSPKYIRGLTVSSKTEDLVFTALAARFESRVEEGVLSVAVRFGF